MLHASLPAPEHGAPPKAGAGLLHERVLVPPLQDALQALHPLHTPFTGRGGGGTNVCPAGCTVTVAVHVLLPLVLVTVPKKAVVMEMDWLPSTTGDLAAVASTRNSVFVATTLPGGDAIVMLEVPPPDGRVGLETFSVHVGGLVGWFDSTTGFPSLLDACSGRPFPVLVIPGIVRAVWPVILVSLEHDPKIATIAHKEIVRMDVACAFCCKILVMHCYRSETAYL